MSGASPVSLERNGEVGVITVNYPPVNALGPGVAEGIKDCLIRGNTDPAIKAMVLIGAGRSFIAGADIRGFGTNRPRLPLGQRVYDALDNSEKPVIAAIHGYALGGGLEIAMACDLRVASDTARLGTAFARVGYSGDFGGSYYLTQLVGTAKARELYFTADLLDAPQALALGLVNRVVPDARLEEETMALASRLARGPRVALRYMKRNMNAAETASLKEMLDLEAWHHTRTGMTEDHREAARAFVDKREPHFKGR